jgi:hypothetical protein
MINHALALLRNVDGNGVDLNMGGEYIPPEFKAVTLGRELRTIRDQLFGPSPDVVYLNYMCRQYLTLLHAGDYAGNVLALDPRVTYWPFDATPYNFGVRQSNFVGTKPLTFLGTMTANDVLGRSHYSWQVERDGATLTILGDDSSTPILTTTLSFTAGLSQAIGIPGKSLSFFVGSDSESNSTWLIDAHGRPDRPLPAVVAALRELGTGPMLALFGTASAEPYRSCSRLWYSHEQLPEQLTGVLLALLHRMEVIRKN